MDSNLKENQYENQFLFKNESIIDNNNPFNIELESKWSEIEQKTQEKINEKKESRRLGILNDFSIMRINLNSLIHPVDDISEFEDLCNLKIKQLEKIKQETIKNKKIITFDEEQKGKNNNLNIDKFKTFLKNDNEIYSKKNGKYLLNDLYEINNKQNKKKLDIKKLFDIIDHNDNDNDNHKSSIINDVNNFDILNNIGNKSDNRLANIKKISFLKEDNGISNNSNKFNCYTQKNNYKKYKGNSKIGIMGNGSNNYRLNGDEKINAIQSKIKDNYNYLYSLYPNLKMKNN